MKKKIIWGSLALCVLLAFLPSRYGSYREHRLCTQLGEDVLDLLQAEPPREYRLAFLGFFPEESGCVLATPGLMPPEATRKPKVEYIPADSASDQAISRLVSSMTLQEGSLIEEPGVPVAPGSVTPSLTLGDEYRFRFYGRDNRELMTLTLPLETGKTAVLTFRVDSETAGQLLDRVKNH